MKYQPFLWRKQTVVVRSVSLVTSQSCFSFQIYVVKIESGLSSTPNPHSPHPQPPTPPLTKMHCNDYTLNYHIRPYYHTYPYKGTVKQFHSLQITASLLFVYFFTKPFFVVDIHLNCTDLIVDAIQMSTHNICFYKENQKK